MITWSDRHTISCMQDVEVRYVADIPVMGHMCLRQNNVGETRGRWYVGKFGESRNWLASNTDDDDGAKVEAGQWIENQLAEALAAVRAP